MGGKVREHVCMSTCWVIGRIVIALRMLSGPLTHIWEYTLKHKDIYKNHLRTFLTTLCNRNWKGNLCSRDLFLPAYHFCYLGCCCPFHGQGPRHLPSRQQVEEEDNWGMPRHLLRRRLRSCHTCWPDADLLDTSATRTTTSSCPWSTATGFLWEEAQGRGR